MVGAELEAVSAGIFRGGSGEQSKRADQRLRALLRGIGRQGDTVSLLRDSMLGLRRLVTFVESAPELHFDAALRTRLGVLGRDLQSLSEFDGQITDKVQFLLDATLGLINIEQNNGIRILTVVSLIGIPPTLIASIYGMNFKNIPELNWSFGYWYALALMVASVALPLAWFRRVGWI
jgi:magnesium transporter